MLKLMKTALLSGVLIVSTALPAAAQGQRVPRCADGRPVVNGKCELPGQQAAPPATPAPEQPRGAQEGNQGAQSGVAQARSKARVSKARSSRTMRNKKRSAAVGRVVPPKAMSNKEAFSLAIYSAAAVAVARKKVGCSRAMFSKHRLSHRQAVGQAVRAKWCAAGRQSQQQFRPARQRPYGNNYGQYGNNYGPYGNNFGRNFDQNEFNRRYYGRYGSDPNNFERNRKLTASRNAGASAIRTTMSMPMILFIAIAARTMKSAARLWARFWVASWAMPYHTARAAPRSRESFLAASAAPALPET